MNRLILGMALAVCSLSALADTAVAVDAYGFIAFNHLDSDNNGYVSRVEARSVAGVERAFDLADANRDGLLDKREYNRVLPEPESY